MKRILVTGGFGFLGSHLLEQLLADADNHVHVVDNLSTSPLPLQELLSELGHPSNLSYTIENVCEFCSSWDESIFDEVFHLASVVGPAGVLPHSGRIAASIINDSIRIAELCMTSGAKLLDVSTSEVYGGGQQGLCSESMPKMIPVTMSPRLEYAEGKLAAETALVNLARAEGLDVRIVRPFNVTGPRQSGRGGFVLPRFIGQAIAGMDITVFGDGKQKRAFTHARDLVNGMALAMEFGPPGEIYNLGNPANRATIGELAEEVRSLTGSRSKLISVDPKSIYGPLFEEANDKFPDATKAITELKWAPGHGRRDTIKETVEYMSRLPEHLLQHLRGF